MLYKLDPLGYFALDVDPQRGQELRNLGDDVFGTTHQVVAAEHERGMLGAQDNGCPI